jgi:hypothetical protein
LAIIGSQWKHAYCICTKLNVWSHEEYLICEREKLWVSCHKIWTVSFSLQNRTVYELNYESHVIFISPLKYGKLIYFVTKKDISEYVDFYVCGIDYFLCPLKYGKFLSSKGSGVGSFLWLLCFSCLDWFWGVFFSATSLTF